MSIDISNQIVKLLASYTDEVERSLEQGMESVAKEAVEELKLKSPERTGRYRKGWRLKKIKGRYVIHNAKYYRLTHLLEKGHAKRGGGRVAAQPHIGGVEKTISDTIQQRIEEALKK